MKLASRFAVGLLLASLAACASGRTYKLDQPADTVPYLRIAEVTTTDVVTRIRFTYEAPGGQSRRIGVHPVGHAAAFRIVGANGKTYTMTEVEGISALPARTLVPGGSTISFTLLFKPIPEDLREFTVGEGDYESGADESAWHFDQVKLGK